MKNGKIDLKNGEIVFCNLILIYNKKLIEVKNVVYKHKDYTFNRMHILKSIGVKNQTSLKVKDIEIIKRLGFENKSNQFTKVKASNEQRNKTTGAYE